MPLKDKLANAHKGGNVDYELVGVKPYDFVVYEGMLAFKIDLVYEVVKSIDLGLMMVGVAEREYREAYVTLDMLEEHLKHCDDEKCKFRELYRRPEWERFKWKV